VDTCREVGVSSREEVEERACCGGAAKAWEGGVDRASEGKLHVLRG
jgi:hypothetical protein